MPSPQQVERYALYGNSPGNKIKWQNGRKGLGRFSLQPSGTHLTLLGIGHSSPEYNVSPRYEALFPAMHPAIGKWRTRRTFLRCVRAKRVGWRRPFGSAILDTPIEMGFGASGSADLWFKSNAVQLRHAARA